MQAFQIIREEASDIVLLAGDLFDSRLPTPEILHQAFELFSFLSSQPKSSLSLERISKQGTKPESFTGIPIIAIHGTHEYRGKEYKNVLQLMAGAGFLVYQHGETILAEKGSERLAVYGLGGVPEKKALDVLRLANPKPQENAFNAFMFHQSVKEFLPFADDMIATISLADLPKGFDLIIDGHIHLKNELTLESSTRMLFPGSTITTQMKKSESDTPKGVYFLDLKTRALDFKPIPNQRKLFYKKMSFEKAPASLILETVKAFIRECLKEPLTLTPLIRVKIVGSLEEGIKPEDLSLKEIEKEFEGKALLSISKSFETVSLQERIRELRELQKDKASIASIGLSILERNLSKTSFNNSFDVQKVFSLLEEDAEKAMDLLKKTFLEREQE